LYSFITVCTFRVPLELDAVAGIGFL
jgi:hypothetical protein